MADPRKSIHSALHTKHLKPLGFRKSGNTSVLQTGADSLVKFKIESYPGTPGGPIRFGVELRVERSSDSGKIIYCLNLPQHATKQQFFLVEDELTLAAVTQTLDSQFQEFVLPALQNASTLQGLKGLFEEIPPHIALFWYYQSYFNLLCELGLRHEAKALLLRTIEEAPHEGVRNAASTVLSALEGVH